jgi:hypothetical protein
MDKYKLEVNRFTSKKQYGLGCLVYPSDKEIGKWNYFLGAFLLAFQFRKNTWFAEKNCDLIILTPVIEDQDVLKLIKSVFDVHVTYKTSIQLYNNTFEFDKKWHGVYNKLYFWNSDYFDYKRFVIMDTDIFVFNPSGYVKLFTNLTTETAGSYENGYINRIIDYKILKFGAPLHEKYTSYKWSDGKSYYNMINAGVLTFVPSKAIFETMIKDLESGWSYIEKKYPAFQGKIGNHMYPEQEYLTGFFSGQWHTIPCQEFMSTISTMYHYGSYPDKFWDVVPDRLHHKTQIKRVIQAAYSAFPKLKDLTCVNEEYLK